MRLIVLTVTASLAFGFAACADHDGWLPPVESPTQPPIGPGDHNQVDPVPGGNVTEPPPGGEGTQPGSTPGAPGSGNPPAGGGGGSPVPEPGTMLLVGTGLAGAALLRRRRQKVLERDRPDA